MNFSTPVSLLQYNYNYRLPMMTYKEIKDIERLFNPYSSLFIHIT